MKKLILILITGIFICTTSYGATIKELLKGKESIKLLCVVEKLTAWFTDEELFDPTDIQDWTPGWKGKEWFIEIKEKSFTKSDNFVKIEYFIGINPIDAFAKTKDGKSERLEEEGRIEINDSYYLLSYYMYLPSDRNYRETYDLIKINRSSGKFNYSRKEYSGGLRMEFEGTCKKAIDKKL